MACQTPGANTGGSKSDKAAGLANQAIGNVKHGVGKAVGSQRFQIEGAVQKAKGRVQETVGDAKEAAKDATKKMTTAINKKL